MLTFILVLLLLAAVFGVLGAVLKIALILALSIVLAIAVLLWAGWWWFRRRVRAFEREWARQSDQEARRRRAVDIRGVQDEAGDDPPALGEGTRS